MEGRNEVITAQKPLDTFQTEMMIGEALRPLRVMVPAMKEQVTCTDVADFALGHYRDLAEHGLAHGAGSMEIKLLAGCDQPPRAHRFVAFHGLERVRAGAGRRGGHRLTLDPPHTENASVR